MKTVLISGGFDPLHVGHIRLIKEAAKHGNVIVALNSDEWLKRKKGYVFMPFKNRAEILEAIDGVITVVPVVDDDDTVCKSLQLYMPDYFANGGDRCKANTPEQNMCQELGIEALWGVGGDDKPAASSDLVKEACKALQMKQFEIILSQR